MNERDFPSNRKYVIIVQPHKPLPDKGKKRLSTEQRKKYSWRKVFDEMFEDPSWCNKTGEPNWCEYLMWDRAKNSNYPMMLGYKYYSDKENDEEVERRMNYGRS